MAASLLRPKKKAKAGTVTPEEMDLIRMEAGLYKALDDIFANKEETQTAGTVSPEVHGEISDGDDADEDKDDEALRG